MVADSWTVQYSTARVEIKAEKHSSFKIYTVVSQHLLTVQVRCLSIADLLFSWDLLSNIHWTTWSWLHKGRTPRASISHQPIVQAHPRLSTLLITIHKMPHKGSTHKEWSRLLGWEVPSSFSSRVEADRWIIIRYKVILSYKMDS